MSDSNRVQLTYVSESTWGTTPGSPAMRTIRWTGETLNYNIQTTTSREVRTDRNIADIATVDASNGGDISFELSFPTHRTFLYDLLPMLLWNDWTLAPEKYNATSDSSITGVTNADDTFAVDAGGASFKAGHLVRTTGFTNSNNNSLFKVSSSTATTVVMAGTPTLTDEAAPPAGARMKVVGFEGASGDITASASGLASTALDFTTLGLVVGQWIKIGGGTAGTQFANVAANNDWARITAIAATALTLDNRPSGWNTDNGAGKTIRVWFGDVLRNGTTKKSISIEKGFMDIATPEYIVFTGMTANSGSLNFQAGEIVNGSASFLGESASISTTSLDGTPDAASTTDILNAVSNVGRIAENGTVVASPNYIRTFSLNINNNVRPQTAVGTLGLVGVGVGEFAFSGAMTAYFGDSTLYTKFLNGTETSVNIRVAKNSQALVFTVPKLKFTSGNVTARGANQDVLAELQWQAKLDSTTSCMFQIDRVEEYA